MKMNQLKSIPATKLHIRTPTLARMPRLILNY